MKTTPFFQTLLLTLLFVAGGTFLSCEKPEEQDQEQPRTPAASVTTSDVDIQGTWECVYPEVTDDSSSLHVTFFEHYYSTKYNGQYYWEQSVAAPQWPQGGYFTGYERANYLIHSGEFYLWNVELEQSWVEIPFYANIPPTFDAFLHGDTLELECLFTRENCPDLDFPEETHYTFVRIN